MAQFVALLRGMNVGGRRISNQELCAHIEALGFTGVSAYLASGNVIVDGGRRTPAQVRRKLESGLRTALEYDVPTFVRTAAEVRAAAAFVPFDELVGADGGKLQVGFMASTPGAAARRAVLAHATPDDQLAIEGRELYHLPRGRLTDSGLDARAIERAVGGLTIRTRRTVEGLAKRLG